MNCLNSWKPVVAMIGVNFALAVVNLLFKIVLSKGMNQFVLATYRQTISAIFLAPIACCLERESYKKLTTFTICALFFSGLMGGTITLYLSLFGLKYTSTSFACGFVNTVPIDTFLMALLFRQEKLNMKCKSGKAKGIVGSSICYAVMAWCVKQRGPVFTSTFSPFIQIFAIVFDVSIIHEQIYLGSILGCHFGCCWYNALLLG
nr:WAT1-related protein At3g30340-like [Ipomoea batatas]